MIRKVWVFYRDGFRAMSPLGRRLWVLIAVKLAVMFLVLRWLFFPAVLGGLDGQESAERVSQELINRR